jgi:hypothetical protein
MIESALDAARDFREVGLDPHRPASSIASDVQHWADALGLGQLAWTVHEDGAETTVDGLTLRYTRRRWGSGVDAFWIDELRAIRPCPTCGEPDAILLPLRLPLLSLGLALATDRHPWHRT